MDCHISAPHLLNSALPPDHISTIRDRVELYSGRPDSIRDSLRSERVEVVAVRGLLYRREVVSVDLVGVSVVSLGLTNK